MKSMTPAPTLIKPEHVVSKLADIFMQHHKAMVGFTLSKRTQSIWRTFNTLTEQLEEPLEDLIIEKFQQFIPDVIQNIDDEEAPEKLLRYVSHVFPDAINRQLEVLKTDETANDAQLKHFVENRDRMVAIATLFKTEYKTVPGEVIYSRHVRSAMDQFGFIAHLCQVYAKYYEATFLHHKFQLLAALVKAKQPDTFVAKMPVAKLIIPSITENAKAVIRVRPYCLFPIKEDRRAEAIQAMKAHFKTR
jgi:hypothetical protein